MTTERIDDLMRNGFRIIQNPELFCFGMDAVLLCAFARIEKADKVIDLGTGNGIIPILLRARYEGPHFTGLEIQNVNVELARRSVKLNRVEDDIDIVLGDIKEASKLFGKASFDVVTTNPPYMNENHGLKNPEGCKAIARHEVLCNLKDVIREAAALLKPSGRFFMVHRPGRLNEILGTMTEYKIEPKRIRLVYPYENKEANMVLIEGIRGGKPLLKVEPPLIVYKQDGEYTEELLRMYNQ